ncbi:uncharacterized protein LOC134608159 [Pelobates fuscus]|uniref:uncharacterized protein LOC134608159 n=1 Tax=Pelobates fuscus TaxID=191477 RepID=UPI002FE49AE2
MSGCCGCSLWEHAEKAYQFMSEILSVSHSHKDPADRTRKPSKMDISLLEEQYLCTKQKQKEQAHIIVFKAGENELMSGEQFMNTVAVNKTIRKPNPFKEQIPVRDVTLEVQNKNYLNERNGSWHAHLNIHRMAQLDCHFNLENGTSEPEHNINIENKRLRFCRLMSYEEPSTEADILIKEKKQRSYSLESTPVNDFNRKASLKHTLPTTWAQHHLPSSKLTSTTDKVFYYPFPQKKTPRISETARKLGLYVTH